MNKDQVKGSVKNVAGKAQNKMGKIVGSKSQQVKGVKNELEGKIQKAAGDSEEVIKDTTTRP